MSIRFYILAAVTLLLAGCNVNSAQLRVGTNIWYGYEPAHLAEQQGYFDSRQIRVLRLSSTSEVIRAYRNGLIDVAAVTIDEALRVSATHGKQRVVLVCDWSNGADALLAQPDLTSLEMLRGRKIGFEETAVGAYLLNRALEQVGLTIADVTTINVPLLEHQKQFETGALDALVTFEPYRTKILQNGARELFNSAQIPHEIGDVIITRERLPSEKETLLKEFVSGWFQALDYIQENSDEVHARLAKNLGLSPEVEKLSRQGIVLVGKQANNAMLSKKNADLLTAFTTVQKKMQSFQLMNADIKLPTLDSSHIPEAMP